MDSNARNGRVTSTTGDVDTNGEVVGELVDRLGQQTRRAIMLARVSLEETGVIAPEVWELVDGSLDALLCARIGTAVDLGRYREKPGLDERIRDAGGDVPCVRRMLHLAVEPIASRRVDP